MYLTHFCGYKLYFILYLDQELAIFFCEGPANIFSVLGYMVSVSTQP